MLEELISMKQEQNPIFLQKEHGNNKKSYKNMTERND